MTNKTKPAKPKLTKKLIKLWIKALESGKYKQGKARLKMKSGNTYRYCCLGVLREIVEKETGQSLEETRHEYLISKLGGSTAINGLSNDMQHHLAALNDAGDSFDDIAEYIKDNYL